MGFFSSKSSSSTNNYNTTVSGTIGDFSEGNFVANELQYNGLTPDQFDTLFAQQNSLTDKALETSQATSREAIEQVGLAYANNETSGINSVIDSIKPIAIFGFGAIVFYFIFK